MNFEEVLFHPYVKRAILRFKGATLKFVKAGFGLNRSRNAETPLVAKFKVLSAIAASALSEDASAGRGRALPGRTTPHRIAASKPRHPAVGKAEHIMPLVVLQDGVAAPGASDKPTQNACTRR